MSAAPLGGRRRRGQLGSLLRDLAVDAATQDDARLVPLPPRFVDLLVAKHVTACCVAQVLQLLYDLLGGASADRASLSATCRAAAAGLGLCALSLRLGVAEGARFDDEAGEQPALNADSSALATALLRRRRLCRLRVMGAPGLAASHRAGVRGLAAFVAAVDIASRGTERAPSLLEARTRRAARKSRAASDAAAARRHHERSVALRGADAHREAARAAQAARVAASTGTIKTTQSVGVARPEAPSAVTHRCHACERAARRPLALAALDVSHNDAGDDGAALLARALRSPAMKGLTSLDVSRSGGLGCAGAEALARAVQAGARRLRRWVLAGNGIAGAGGAAIASAVPLLPHLEVLVLRRTQLGDEGGIPIVRAVAQHAVVATLDMASCGAGDDTCEALRLALEAQCRIDEGVRLGFSPSSIAWLSFEDNSRISGAGLAALAEASTRLRRLSALRVGGTRPGARGIAALCHVAQRTGAASTRPLPRRRRHRRDEPEQAGAVPVRRLHAAMGAAHRAVTALDALRRARRAMPPRGARAGGALSVNEVADEPSLQQVASLSLQGWSVPVDMHGARRGGAQDAEDAARGQHLRAPAAAGETTAWHSSSPIGARGPTRSTGGAGNEALVATASTSPSTQRIGAAPRRCVPALLLSCALSHMPALTSVDLSGLRVVDAAGGRAARPLALVDVLQGVATHAAALRHLDLSGVLVGAASASRAANSGDSDDSEDRELALPSRGADGASEPRGDDDGQEDPGVGAVAHRGARHGVVAHVDARLSEIAPAAPLVDLLMAASSLRTLALQGVALQAEGAVALAGALGRCVSLTALDASGNAGMGSEGAAALVCATVGVARPPVRRLSLGRCGVDRGVVAVLSGLLAASPHASRLRELSVARNPALTERAATDLADALRQRHCRLRRLDVSSCRFGDIGASRIASAICREECPLRSLDVSGCGIRSQGCAEMASALRNASCGLQELALGGGNKVSIGSAEALLRALHHDAGSGECGSPTARGPFVLDISQSYMPPEASITLEAVLHRSSAVRLARGVRRLCSCSRPRAITLRLSLSSEEGTVTLGTLGAASLEPRDRAATAMEAWGVDDGERLRGLWRGDGWSHAAAVHVAMTQRAIADDKAGRTIVRGEGASEDPWPLPTGEA